jgi:zinc transporter ZupT
MAPLSEVAVGKLVLSLVLGPLTFFASTAPWCASRIFRKDALDIINLLTAMAAGFVFGGYSTHIIPDGIEAFGDYFEATYSPDSDSKIPDYPWSLLISGLIWAMLVCLDRTLVAHGVHGDAHHSHDHVSQAYVQMQAETESGPLLDASVVHPCTHDGAPSAPSGCKEAEKAARKDAMLRAWLFFVALSVHSVFDGLGVGVTNSVEQFGSVAVAVVAHKMLLGYRFEYPSSECRIFP